MVYVGRHLDRLGSYAQLSMWERQVLKIWIVEQVDLTMIWRYTSLGLVERFEDSALGFAITHGQLKQAMLHAGYRVRNMEADIWLFDLPADEETVD